MLSRIWSRWADVLAVKPATVIAWHRRGFARFRAYKSLHVGRRPLSAEVVALIAPMSKDNPIWSRRRIGGELAMLGWNVSKDMLARYMSEPRETGCFIVPGGSLAGKSAKPPGRGVTRTGNRTKERAARWSW